MARYYYKNNEGERVYIKTIDTANGKLTFTKKPSEAYSGRDGYYASPLRDSLKFGFIDDYPQLENLYIE